MYIKYCQVWNQNSKFVKLQCLGQGKLNRCHRLKWSPLHINYLFREDTVLQAKVTVLETKIHCPILKVVFSLFTGGPGQFEMDETEGRSASYQPSLSALYRSVRKRFYKPQNSTYSLLFLPLFLTINNKKQTKLKSSAERSVNLYGWS